MIVGAIIGDIRTHRRREVDAQTNLHISEFADDSRELLAIRERVFTAIVEQFQLKTVDAAIRRRRAIGALIERIIAMCFDDLNTIAALDILLSACQIHADALKHHIVATGNIRVCSNGIRAWLELFRQTTGINQNNRAA